MKLESEQQFVAKLITLLDESVAELEPQWTQQLDHARQKALVDRDSSLLASTNDDHAIQSTNLTIPFDSDISNFGKSLDDPERLGKGIQTRLDAIRHQAVAAHARSSHAQVVEQISLFGRIRAYLATFSPDQLSFAAATGMIASSFVVVTAIALLYTGSMPNMAPDERANSDTRLVDTLAVEEEIGLLASAEDLELYENLDFYLWLAEAELPELPAVLLDSTSGQFEEDI